MFVRHRDRKIIPSTNYCIMIAGIGFVWGIILTILMYNLQILDTEQNRNKDINLVMTNEHYVDDVRSNHVDLENVGAVWQLVFSQLPSEVYVHPTENYYYFTFYAAGREVWGNIRLGVQDRQENKITFAYFCMLNRLELPLDFNVCTKSSVLSINDGVDVRKIDSLTYSVTYQEKKVIFRLNNIPQSIPDNMQLREGEEFVFRTFDESGFQFALVFDGHNPAFRFILDETAPLPDVLQSIDDKLMMGLRSGFAFYLDKELDRKVLVGVDMGNVAVNNYYDGPFDQLADNFIIDDRFKSYLLRAYDSLEANKINNQGVSLGDDGKPGTGRIALHPLLMYNSLQHLQEYVAGCRKETSERQVVACLTKDEINR